MTLLRAAGYQREQRREGLRAPAATNHLPGGSMAQVKDPVCGMEIDSATAAGSSTYDGTDYYFCSSECKKAFDHDPSRYVHAATYTKKGGMVSPKFGSAASGGLEYEPSPGPGRR
jgi:Cu+-exporting ATPase